MDNGRNSDGTFSKGNTRKPKGSRNLKTVAIEFFLNDKQKPQRKGQSLKHLRVTVLLLDSVWSVQLLPPKIILSASLCHPCKVQMMPHKLLRAFLRP